MKQMPNDAVVDAGMRIEPKWPVDIFPSGMYVKGPLECVDNPALTCVEDNVCIDGQLLMSGCPSLLSIGNNLRVKGDCDLTNDISLNRIGDNLIVDGSLILTGCSTSISLPTHGHVKKDLILPVNYDLLRLSDEFKVEEEIMFGESLDD